MVKIDTFYRKDVENIHDITAHTNQDSAIIVISQRMMGLYQISDLGVKRRFFCFASTLNLAKIEVMHAYKHILGSNYQIWLRNAPKPLNIDLTGEMAKITKNKPNALYKDFVEKVPWHQNGQILPYHENLYIDENLQNVWIMNYKT